MSGGEPSSIKRHFRVCRGQPAGAAMGLMRAGICLQAGSRFFNQKFRFGSLVKRELASERETEGLRLPAAPPLSFVQHPFHRGGFMQRRSVCGTASGIIPQMAAPDL